MIKYKVYIMLNSNMAKMFQHLYHDRYSETNEYGDLIGLYAVSYDKKYVKKFLKIRDSSMFFVKEIPTDEKNLTGIEVLYNIIPYTFEGSSKEFYIPAIEKSAVNKMSNVEGVINVKNPDLELTKVEKDMVLVYSNMNRKDEFNRWIKYYSPTMDLKKLYKYLL